MPCGPSRKLVNMLLLTVVIPAYNRAELLRETLASVLSDRADDFEVVVVDDGSVDHTPSVIAEFSADPRVRTARQENAGQSVARNRGIAIAAGEYVAFLDSDDLWLAWTIPTLRTVIDQARRPAVIVTRSELFRDASEAARLRPAPPVWDEFADVLSYYDQGNIACFGAGFLVVRREVLQDCGGFPETRNNSEDIDLCLRIGVSGRLALLKSPVMFAQRRHEGNVSNQVIRSIQGMNEVIQRERAQLYPGGERRALGRRALITFMTRAISVFAVRDGFFRLGWRLYRDSFGWNLRLRRVRYLLGFPVMLLLERCGLARRGRPSA